MVKFGRSWAYTGAKLMLMMIDFVLNIHNIWRTHTVCCSLSSGFGDHMKNSKLPLTFFSSSFTCRYATWKRFSTPHKNNTFHLDFRVRVLCLFLSLFLSTMFSWLAHFPIRSKQSTKKLSSDFGSGTTTIITRRTESLKYIRRAQAEKKRLKNEKKNSPTRSLTVG